MGFSHVDWCCLGFRGPLVVFCSCGLEGWCNESKSVGEFLFSVSFRYMEGIYWMNWLVCIVGGTYIGASGGLQCHVLY
jgi:hypothetical protein